MVDKKIRVDVVAGEDLLHPPRMVQFRGESVFYARDEENGVCVLGISTSPVKKGEHLRLLLKNSGGLFKVEAESELELTRGQRVFVGKQGMLSLTGRNAIGTVYGRSLNAPIQNIFNIIFD